MDCIGCGIGALLVTEERAGLELANGNAWLLFAIEGGERSIEEVCICWTGGDCGVIISLDDSRIGGAEGWFLPDKSDEGGIFVNVCLIVTASPV